LRKPGEASVAPGQLDSFESPLANAGVDSHNDSIAVATVTMATNRLIDTLLD
jgi:hypothetical protein